jgi:hypothetical protein
VPETSWSTMKLVDFVSLTNLAHPLTVTSLPMYVAKSAANTRVTMMFVAPSGDEAIPVSACLFSGCCARFHVDKLPEVPIQILETVLVHESMVFRLVGCCSAGCNSLADHLIDFFTTIER